MTELDFEPSGPHPEGRIAWLRWAMLCDDTRVEDTGKRILIGCYDNAILFAVKPSVLSVKLIGAFEFIVPGNHKVQLRVRTPSFVGIGEINSESPEPGAYGEFNVPVSVFVEKPSSILLDWRMDDGPWGPPMKWELEFSDDARELGSTEVEALKKQWIALTRGSAQQASDDVTLQDA